MSRLGCVLFLGFTLLALPSHPAFAQVRLVDEVLLKPATVHSAVALPDGSFAIASDTTHVDSTAVNSSLLNFTAQFELRQNWGPSIEGAKALALDAQSQWLYVGGVFDSIAGAAIPRLARISLTGQLDAWALSPSEGQPLPSAIEKLAILPDGSVLAVHRPGSSASRELLLVNASSGSYSVILGLNDEVFDLQVLGDGSVLVGGAFEFVTGLQRRGLVRLAAGTLAVDGSFAQRPVVPGLWSWSRVRDIALNSAGDVYVSTGPAVHRLNADGTTARAFQSPVAFDLVEQIAFDAQDRPYVLMGWPFSLGPNPPQGYSGLWRFDSSANHAQDPSFDPPQIVGRGARLLVTGDRVLVLGSLRSTSQAGVGAMSLSTTSSTPTAMAPSLGSSSGVRFHGAVPAAGGGALIFGEFTHVVGGTRLWGTLRLNAEGQRLAGPFMDFLGTPNAFAATPGGELLYTSSIKAIPRPEDWGAQSPEGTWALGAVRLSDGAWVPDFNSGRSGDANVLKSGAASYGSGFLVAERNRIRTGDGTGQLAAASTALPFGSTRRIAVRGDGAAVFDRSPPPANAFAGGGVIIFPPPPSSPQHMLYRWLPGPAEAVGLGPIRTARFAQLGGFDVHAGSGVIYASFPGQTTAEPAWVIRRFDPAGAPEGQVLGTLSDHWAPGGIAVDEAGEFVYVGGLGPLGSSGERPPRVFRVSTGSGEVDPNWPSRGGEALQPNWMYRFGDRIFALSATASGTYAAFYRTDDVVFEDGFEH